MIFSNGDLTASSLRPAEATKLRMNAHRS